MSIPSSGYEPPPVRAAARRTWWAGHTAPSRAYALFKELAQARVDHSFQKLSGGYLIPELLIVDDFELHRLTAQPSHDPRWPDPARPEGGPDRGLGLRSGRIFLGEFALS
jgi:hypothetical protein